MNDYIDRYPEIYRLKTMLLKANIQFDFHESEESCQIELFDRAFRYCSVIEGILTYGGRQDVLEIMGLLTPEESKIDNVKGFMTAEAVFKRIQEYNTSHKVKHSNNRRKRKKH